MTLQEVCLMSLYFQIIRHYFDFQTMVLSRLQRDYFEVQEYPPLISICLNLLKLLSRKAHQVLTKGKVVFILQLCLLNFQIEVLQPLDSLLAQVWVILSHRTYLLELARTSYQKHCFQITLYLLVIVVIRTIQQLEVYIFQRQVCRRMCLQWLAEMF